MRSSFRDLGASSRARRPSPERRESLGARGRHLLSSSLAKVKRRGGKANSVTYGDGYFSDGAGASGDAIDASRRSDASSDQWDLDACITAIETLRGADFLTPEQLAAVKHLRPAAVLMQNAMAVTAPNEGRDGEEGFPASRSRSMRRRDAKFFGKASRHLLMTKQLSRCFHEVEENVEDADMRAAVMDILADYGGEIFSDKFSIAAPLGGPEKRGDRGDSPPQRRGAAIERARESMNLGEVFQPARRDSATRRLAASHIEALDYTESLSSFYKSDSGMGAVYCPPEWNALTKSARVQLTRLLSWENLSRWDFDVLEVARLSEQVLRGPYTRGQFCPLLLVGWAILCAPAAQRAMEGSLPAEEVVAPPENSGHSPYHFVVDLDVSPESVCGFLRAIEGKYYPDVPYHNNTHAADVTQTLHCLLQFMGEDLERLYGPVELFSILLAATFHDVGHPGLNNLFYKNTRKDMAIRYNDVSILENMHSAIGHELLMGADKRKDWDVFEKWTDANREKARSVMVQGVLATDMSHHFESMNDLASRVSKVRKAQICAQGSAPQIILPILAQALSSKGGEEGDASAQEESRKFATDILNALLHCADISNPAKPKELCIHWAEKMLTEFFAQGDKEKELGLTPSPLCDRNTVKKEDSQIGFLSFVVRPAFALLGEIVPGVEEVVMPKIEENINHWTQSKQRMSTLKGKETAAAAIEERPTPIEEEEGIEKKGAGEDEAGDGKDKTGDANG